MITQQILTTADRVPDNVAVNYNGFDVSYRRFAALIRRATSYFARRGFVGDGIAVIATGGLDAFWIWSLALRRLGLTTVAAGSLEEVEDLKLSGIRFVFQTPEDDWPGLPAYCARHGYTLHKAETAAEPELDHDDAPPYAPGGHILKTSGTTGVVKKILIEASSEDFYADDRARFLNFDASIVCNVFRLNPSTGLGYKVPVNVWAVGGCIIQNQQNELFETFGYRRATYAVLTPPMLTEILAAPAGSFPLQEGMTLCVTAGTISKTELADAKRRITPLIYNMLATTEIGIFAFTPFETPEDQRWHRALPGSDVQVVDDDDLPVKPGTVGRLRVANPSAARYVEDDPANRMFFRSGYFYPGDLAELHADGRIALQGRTTDVINIRGTKLSPAAVEARLSEECDGRRVCLFSMQDGAGEEQVHCLIEGPAPVDEARLGSILAQELGVTAPNVRYVPTMPHTESGKVIRGRLREMIVA